MFGIDDAISAGANLITKILDKVAPDADEDLKNKLTLALTEMQNEYAVTLKQLDVNNTEASNPHWFVAGWRPFIGWVCGLGIGYQVLLSPILNGVLMVVGVPSAFPLVDTSLLQTLIGGMLGLGVARSYEKGKGVQTSNLTR
jgi:hypothetical protein